MNQNYFMNFWDHLKKKEEFHSLAFFRIGFGIVMMVEISRFYLHGFIENLFVKQDFHFKAGKCLFFLDEAGKSIIHEIKYHGSHEVLSDFHHWMERSPGFEEFLDEAHLIPVPLHKSRQSSRGFNQSLWIAQAIKKYMGSSVEIGDFMKRTRNTPTQTRLEKKARKKNVKNAFALKPGVCLDSLHRIILIDDVFTTGATLDACAQVWVEAGISQVEVAALGHG